MQGLWQRFLCRIHWCLYNKRNVTWPQTVLHFLTREKKTLYLSATIKYRVPKWWRHKNWICEITNLIVIFRKNKMKNASMPKFSILPPISDEIFPRLCSDDPIQILFKLAWFLTLRTKPFLQGFVWSHWSITVVISRRQFAPTCWFLARIHV